MCRTTIARRVPFEPRRGEGSFCSQTIPFGLRRFRASMLVFDQLIDTQGWRNGMAGEVAGSAPDGLKRVERTACWERDRPERIISLSGNWAEN